LASVPPLPPIPACFSFNFQAHVSSFLHFFFSDLLRCCTSLLFIRCSSIAINMRYSKKTFFFKKKKMLF
jgi:hypothetical protein